MKAELESLGRSEDVRVVMTPACEVRVGGPGVHVRKSSGRGVGGPASTIFLRNSAYAVAVWNETSRGKSHETLGVQVGVAAGDVVAEG
jgi:hypothetical protein